MKRISRTGTLVICQACGVLADVSLDPDLRKYQEADHKLDTGHGAEFRLLATTLGLAWKAPGAGRKIK